MTRTKPTSAEGLVDELAAIRGRERSDAARRRALDERLRTAVDGLPPAERGSLIDRLREHFVDEARAAIERTASLEAEAVELRRRVESLTAERDAAVRERDTAARERDAAARSAAERNEATATIERADAALPGGTADAERVLAALARLAEGARVDAASAGLDPAEARLFDLMRELLRFAQDYEMAVHVLMAEFSVGPAAGMDTRMMRGLRQVVRDRFRACLDGRDGALDELKQVLSTNARFLVDLNSAYGASVHEGSKRLLGRLDPQRALERNRRMLGHDFETALRELARVHGDLANLSRSEIWERFFFEPFREGIVGGPHDGTSGGER